MTIVEKNPPLGWKHCTNASSEPAALEDVSSTYLVCRVKLYFKVLSLLPILLNFSASLICSVDLQSISAK